MSSCSFINFDVDPVTYNIQFVSVILERIYVCPGVFWASNPKAWMTQNTFRHWFDYCFLPEVEQYLDEV